MGVEMNIPIYLQTLGIAGQEIEVLSISPTYHNEYGDEIRDEPYGYLEIKESEEQDERV